MCITRILEVGKEQKEKGAEKNIIQGHFQANDIKPQI